jgi:hypothetical protein
VPQGFKEEYKFTGYELVETLLDNLRVFSMPTPRVAKDKLREACIQLEGAVELGTIGT